MQRFRQPPFLLLLATAFGIAGSSPASACQICIPFPKKSTADYLIEADALVLAREDPERPFHYASIETLKGDPGDEKIDLFVDSTTRRVLTAHPEWSIVLARSTAGEKKSWKRIGMADDDLGPIVRDILAASAIWEKAPEIRIAYFAKRLGHGNSLVRTLAHLEIAWAPYNEIRKCSMSLPPEEIRRFLNCTPSNPSLAPRERWGRKAISCNHRLLDYRRGEESTVGIRADPHGGLHRLAVCGCAWNYSQPLGTEAGAKTSAGLRKAPSAFASIHREDLWIYQKMKKRGA
jgi:hypothetical protein